MRILYVCTHNRCRSILSEAITNHMAGAKVRAYSAGSQAVDQVHPLSLKYLKEKDVPIDGLYSKSFDALEDQNFDIVVTVCESAAKESCPTWFGDAIILQWPLADPSKIQGDDQELKNAFMATIKIIETRTAKLLSILESNQDMDLIQKELKSLT